MVIMEGAGDSIQPGSIWVWFLLVVMVALFIMEAGRQIIRAVKTARRNNRR